MAEWRWQAYQSMMDMVTIAKMIIHDKNITMKDVNNLMEVANEFYPKIHMISLIKLLKRAMRVKGIHMYCVLK